MWRFFSACSILLLLISSSFSKPAASVFSPVFRDSILKNKIDSAKWNSVVLGLDIHHPPASKELIQHQKKSSTSLVFLIWSGIILLLLLLLRLLFDDFSFSLLEGMLSMKKFFIFYQSKKYDSYLAIIVIYILKITILSLIVYIGLQHFMKDDFSTFHTSYFLDIWLLMTLFFTVKNVVEFIFNWVIDTQETFKAFFLQNLFAEFILMIVLLILLLIYIYNENVSYHFITGMFIFSLAGYVVFNIIRSYQLMQNIRIPYKLHFFLYICAFKIIPMLLLTKYILSNVVE